MVVETPELVEQVPEAVDVRQPRQVAKRQRLIGEKRAGKQGEGGVFAPEIGILPSRRLPP
jgi:hypothetical protein